VTVTSLDRGTVDTVTSNASGYYLKDRLLPGRYELKAELRGFRRHPGTASSTTNNCSGWTTDSAFISGYTMRLKESSESDNWTRQQTSCAEMAKVWCASDPL
jgi:hypothetical protein